MGKIDTLHTAVPLDYFLELKLVAFYDDIMNDQTHFNSLGLKVFAVFVSQGGGEGRSHFGFRASCLYFDNT